MEDKTYPEHEKLSKVAAESQAVGEFLDWLGGGYEGSPGYHVCAYHEGTYGDAAIIADALSGNASDRVPDPSGYFPISEQIPQLLARYFGIDQQKLDAEKKQMLEDIRS